MWNSKRREGAKKRIGWALLLAAFTLFAAIAAATEAPNRRQRAIAAYEKAQQMHASLEARSAGNRTKAEYQKVIDAYMEVYRQSPGYSKSPAALTAIAELYREMGRTFSSDSYYLEAIKTYRLLVNKYQQSRLTREALPHDRRRVPHGLGRIRTKPAKRSRFLLPCFQNPMRSPRPKKG